MDKQVKIEFFGNEYQIKEQSQTIKTSLMIAEDKIKEALEKLGLELDFEYSVGLSYLKRNHEFECICIYPSEICNVVDAINELYELECDMYDLLEIYTIQLKLVQILYLGVDEIAEMINELDKAYSRSLFAAYEFEEFDVLEYNKAEDAYFALVEDTCTMFNSDLQKVHRIKEDEHRRLCQTRYTTKKMKYDKKLEIYRWESLYRDEWYKKREGNKQNTTEQIANLQRLFREINEKI